MELKLYSVHLWISSNESEVKGEQLSLKDAEALAHRLNTENPHWDFDRAFITPDCK